MELARVAVSAKRPELAAATSAAALRKLSFTFVEIERVEPAFFTSWRRERVSLVQQLAEKYLLHCAGGAGDQAREQRPTTVSI